ncbi:MAG TPA: hypothetical protein VJI70_00075 [Candidatus Paceibacterota bacterium]
MATATINKTDRLLIEVLREVREVRSLVEHPSRSVSTHKRSTKKLPKWLQASLKDSDEGKVSGPFYTADELMKHLQKK